MISPRILWALGFAVAVSGPALAQQVTPAANPSARSQRPNIVILLADDMGFSDMGMFGSEIQTPNLDALAKEGARFTNFYTHASCSPTRSMLLTGTDTHRNGLGNMDEWTAPNQVGVPGYEGYLNNRVVTLPQLLKDAGYHTYMVGKWHMGKAPDKIPAARGFERDFTLLDGAGSYWDMTNFTAASPMSNYTEDGQVPHEAPRGFLRHEDLHGQADRFHRREPRRRQTVLRLCLPSGAARSVSPPSGLARSARGRVRPRVGRGEGSAAQTPDRAWHHAGRHGARRTDVVPP